LTFVNPKTDTEMSVNCSLGGATAAEAKAGVLHHEDLNACNTFQEPNRIVPRDLAVRASGTTVSMNLPSLNIATAIGRLA
jgi:alpha-L-arabinofuranosidase